VAALPAYTFAHAVREYLDGNKLKWRSPVSARQWYANLRNHALPTIAHLPMSDITR